MAAYSVSAFLTISIYFLATIASVTSRRARRQESTGRPWWEDIDETPPASLSSDHNTVKPFNEPTRSSLTSGSGAGLTLNDLADLASLFEGAAAPPETDCECVPYYQCKEGFIVTDGQGVIDIRFGETYNDTASKRLNSHSRCTNFLDVCCQQPNTAVTPGPGPVDQYIPKCGHRNPTGVNARITGFTATQSQFGEFPWMAAVLQTEYVGDEEVNLYLCGASLIHSDVVLTAAHCVQSWTNTPDILKVRLGEWDTQRQYELYTHVDRRVKAVITHERFNPGSLSNDYALLLLESPVPLTHNIDTVCLPDLYGDVESVGCFVTGWGKNEFGQNGQYQNILKKVSLPMVAHRECEVALQRTRLGKHFRLHTSFNCAGGGQSGQDACKGDGGSPLVCPRRADHSTYVQVGIVAWGIGCGDSGVPGVYADVIKGMTWVNQQLSKLPYTRTG